MENAKLKATDLTARLFIKTPISAQVSEKRITFLKLIFNFILTKIQDTVRTVKLQIAAANEGDVNLLLIDIVLEVRKSYLYNTERFREPSLKPADGQSREM